MSSESQRIKIAEACGWTIHGSSMRIVGNPDDKFGACSAYHDLYGFPRSGKDGWIPDYLNDLNAAHEMEKTLGQLHRGIYSQELEKLLAIYNSQEPHINSYLWHATAAQRSEAFLKTKGLWVEEDVSGVTVEGLR